MEKQGAMFGRILRVRFEYIDRANSNQVAQRATQALAAALDRGLVTRTEVIREVRSAGGYIYAKS